MVASCHRRMLAYARALELYEEIHVLHPDNMECLRYLVVLCKDLGRRYDNFEGKLLRLERQVAQSAAATGALFRGGSLGNGYTDNGTSDQNMYQQQHFGGGGNYEGSGYVGSDEPVGAVDGRVGVSDHAYGSSADRFAAPSISSHVASPLSGSRAAREDETFADADLSDLLAD